MRILLRLNITDDAGAILERSAIALNENGTYAYLDEEGEELDDPYSSLSRLLQDAARDIDALVHQRLRALNLKGNGC